MSHVFLVGSPLQLWNAYEARHALGLRGEDCFLVVINRNSARNLEQIEALIGEDTWAHVEVHGLVSGFHWYRVLRALRSLAKTVAPAETVFVGYYLCTFMRDFVYASQAETVFLLDDGSATMETAWMREAGQDPTESGGVRRWVKRQLLRMQTGPFPELHYFSAHRPPLSSVESLLPNTFVRLRAASEAQSTADDQVVFLGSCLSELGILARPETYIHHVEAALSGYRDRSILYAAHREESDEKLEQIERSLELEVVRPELPIELELCQAPARPGAVVSFYSSALVNCDALFRERVEVAAYHFAPEEVSPAVRDFVMRYYDYLVGEFPRIRAIGAATRSDRCPV